MISIWKGVLFMNSILGIINLNEDDRKIAELTYNRPIAAIPFAGRYRIIDFTISNMVNSEINHVFIFTRDKYRSVTDHIQTGRAWDLERKNKGIFIFSPLQNYYPGVRSSDMDIISDYLDYIYYSKENYVVISPSYFINTLNYKKMLSSHIEKKADVTVAYKKVDNMEELEGVDSLVIDDNGKVIDILSDRLGPQNVFMETVMLDRKLFIDIVNKKILGADNDLLIKTIFQLKNNLNIFSFEYEGYLARIDSIKSYYKRNIELLNTEVADSIFSEKWPIYTKAKDEPPTKYQLNAETINSLIASGCQIDGRVENSVLFRRVTVHKGVNINNCIIMQNSEVEDNVILENVILDKNVIITKDKIIKGTPDKPVIIEKNQMI